MKLRATFLSAGIVLAAIGATPAVAGADPGPAPGAPAIPIGPRPLVSPIEGVTQIGFYNWSGYAQSAATGTFRSVADTWTVPTVNTGFAGDQYSSDWVGIGGFSESTLVQAGTEADNIGGTAFYRAWTEILPEAENPLPMTIKAGNKITTTVEEKKPGVWIMTVDDKTTKTKESRTVEYSGSSHASVEAVHERPCVRAPCNSNEDLANLAQTTNVTFNPGKYGTAVGKAPKTVLMSPAAGATVYQMFMYNNTATEKIASPSEPDSDNDGFTVADGSVSPPPPKS